MKKESLQQEGGGKGGNGVAGDLGQAEASARELLGRTSNVDVGVGDLVFLLLVQAKVVQSGGDSHESHGVLMTTGSGGRGLVIGLNHILRGGSRGNIGIVLTAQSRDLEGITQNVSSSLDTRADLGLAGRAVIEADTVRTVGTDSMAYIIKKKRSHA